MAKWKPHTPEQIAKYREYHRNYIREYYKKHPEKRREKAIQYALSLLRKHDYTITGGEVHEQSKGNA